MPVRAGRTEKFLFRLLHESEEVRKKDDAGRVGIRPVGLNLHLEHDRDSSTAAK